MTAADFVTDPDYPHAVRALMNALAKRVRERPTHPDFALVAFGDDGRPYSLTRGNRTCLTVAAIDLLVNVMELEKQENCLCETCDQWTAKARAMLQAADIKIGATH